MNVDSRELSPEVPTMDGRRSRTGNPPPTGSIGPEFTLLHLAFTAAWIAGTLLAFAFSTLGSEPQSDKRVESRGTPIDTTAQPVDSKPNPPSAARPEPKPECEVVKQTIVEETKTVEEVHIVQTVEIPSSETSLQTSVRSDFLTFEEVLQNTLGRRKMTTVAACTDWRNPLPSYAFVGIQLPLTQQNPHHTVRLQRFECELEAGSDWEPAHSLFTVAIGQSLFQFTVDASGIPSPFIARDAATQRTFPLLVSLSKRRTASAGDRYLLSIHCKDAELGQAPRVVEGDGIYLSVDPAPTAPPIYGTPRFVLVERRKDADSSLRLIEKSGSLVSILPNLNDHELAAYCSVVHSIPR